MDEGPFVGRKPDACKLAGEVEPFHQLAREKDRAVEHAQDDGRAVEVLEIVIDALRYGVDGLLQPLVGDVGYEVPVFDENPAFHLLDDLICENTHYLLLWQTESEGCFPIKIVVKLNY